MKTTLTSFLSIALLSLLVTGCAKPPQQAIDAARAALDAAAAAEADRYVPDLFLAASDSLSMATTEIEMEMTKSRFSRNFDHAASLIQYASTTAAEATTLVAERKEAMRIENEQLFAQAETAIANVTELMTKAPRGKDGQAALVSIREDVALTSGSISEARAAQEGGDFVRARELTRAAIDKAAGLAGELESAIARTGGARRS